MTRSVIEPAFPDAALDALGGNYRIPAVQCWCDRDSSAPSRKRSDCPLDNAVPRAGVDDRHAMAVTLGA